MTIRRAKEDDLVFVRSSWLRSYASSEFSHMISKRDAKAEEASQIYWSGQRLLINSILSRAECLVEEDTAGLIAGWIVFEPSHTLHYSYVRMISRRQGVFRRLCDVSKLEKDVIMSHWPRGMQRDRLPPTWRFDPYVLMR